MILGIGGCRQKLPLRQLIGRWKTAALNWQLLYGGEPLLNFKLMKAVIERSQAKREQRDCL